MSRDSVRSPRIPSFARSSEYLTDAYLFARDAHATGRTRIEHPAAVAELLSDAGYPEHVVATALLHDVVEDSPSKAGELATRFGPAVARLVAQLTEDPAIPSFQERKRELRRRAAGDGPTAAAIFTADKLASVRALNASGGVPDPQKLDHYMRTVNVVRRTHPEVPFLVELEDEVARLRDRVGV
jgi:(p)ppGpp synthase/HD superfamily hydrolase